VRVRCESGAGVCSPALVSSRNEAFEAKRQPVTPGTAAQARRGTEVAPLVHMTRRKSSAAARAASQAPAPRAPSPAERSRLLDWLDDGLRRGERRLEAEYPLALGAGAGAVQRVVFDGEAPVAHALLQSVEVLARGRALRVGLVGSVYSDPAQRGRGFAQACVRACVDEARAQGLALVLLWSELAGFYARLGFAPCGRDTLLGVDGGLLGRANGGESLAVSAPAPAEFAALEALYARKPVRVHRTAGALARLAAAPETVLLAARRAGTAVAYAALGRGDDFRGVVHEWAGEGRGVLACLGELVRRHGPLRMLAGPEPEPPVPALVAAGAPLERRSLGLARLLDAGELWCAIAPRSLGVRFVQRGDRVELLAGSARAVISTGAALELFFGAGPRVLGEAHEPQTRRALEAALPWPLYVWGFDSV
jgi:GNAT superfamily N-acetyltransferase